MDAESFCTLALSLPEAAQSSHMGAVDFRVRGKIFAQPPGSPGGSAIVKLTREQQEMMCAAEPAVFAPEPGHWGRLGWTRLAVGAIDEVTARSALWTAWRNVAPKALSKVHGQSKQATTGNTIRPSPTTPPRSSTRRNPRCCG